MIRKRFPGFPPRSHGTERKAPSLLLPAEDPGGIRGHRNGKLPGFRLPGLRARSREGENRSPVLRGHPVARNPENPPARRHEALDRNRILPALRETEILGSHPAPNRFPRGKRPGPRLLPIGHPEPVVLADFPLPFGFRGDRGIRRGDRERPGNRKGEAGSRMRGDQGKDPERRDRPLRRDRPSRREGGAGKLPLGNDEPGSRKRGRVPRRKEPRERECRRAPRERAGRADTGIRRLRRVPEPLPEGLPRALLGPPAQEIPGPEGFPLPQGSPREALFSNLRGLRENLRFPRGNPEGRERPPREDGRMEDGTDREGGSEAPGFLPETGRREERGSEEAQNPQGKPREKRGRVFRLPLPARDSLRQQPGGTDAPPYRPQAENQPGIQDPEVSRRFRRARHRPAVAQGETPGRLLRQIPRAQEIARLGGPVSSYICKR